MSNDREEEENMLFIDLAEEELKYFDDMKSKFPDNMIINSDFPHRK